MAFAFIKNLFHHKNSGGGSGFDASTLVNDASQAVQSFDSTGSNSSSLPALPSFTPSTPSMPSQANTMFGFPKEYVFGAGGFAAGFALGKITSRKRR